MSTILLVFLGIWLRLLFKVLFVSKCIKIMFFYFLKSIFKISASKRSKTKKKKKINKKKFGECGAVPKRSLHNSETGNPYTEASPMVGTTCLINNIELLTSLGSYMFLSVSSFLSSLHISDSSLNLSFHLII